MNEVKGRGDQQEDAVLLPTSGRIGNATASPQGVKVGYGATGPNNGQK